MREKKNPAGMPQTLRSRIIHEVMKRHLIEGLYESRTSKSHSLDRVGMQETGENLGHQITESSSWKRSEACSELMLKVYLS